VFTAAIGGQLSRWIGIHWQRVKNKGLVSHGGESISIIDYLLTLWEAPIVDFVWFNSFEIFYAESVVCLVIHKANPLDEMLL